MTTVQADGLTVSTPTGSTAYSVSLERIATSAILLSLSKSYLPVDLLCIPKFRPYSSRLFAPTRSPSDRCYFRTLWSSVFACHTTLAVRRGLVLMVVVASKSSVSVKPPYTSILILSVKSRGRPHQSDRIQVPIPNRLCR
jgi:hypothetical protein